MANLADSTEVICLTLPYIFVIFILRNSLVFALQQINKSTIALSPAL